MSPSGRAGRGRLRFLSPQAGKRYKQPDNRTQPGGKARHGDFLPEDTPESDASQAIRVSMRSGRHVHCRREPHARQHAVGRVPVRIALTAAADANDNSDAQLCKATSPNGPRIQEPRLAARPRPVRRCALRRGALRGYRGLRLSAAGGRSGLRPDAPPRFRQLR